MKIDLMVHQSLEIVAHAIRCLWASIDNEDNYRKSFVEKYSYLSAYEYKLQVLKEKRQKSLLLFRQYKNLYVKLKQKLIRNELEDTNDFISLSNIVYLLKNIFGNNSSEPSHS